MVLCINNYVCSDRKKVLLETIKMIRDSGLGGHADYFFIFLVAPNVTRDGYCGAFRLYPDDDPLPLQRNTTLIIFIRGANDHAKTQFLVWVMVLLLAPWDLATTATKARAVPKKELQFLKLKLTTTKQHRRRIIVLKLADC
jgi:hypothetical protein